MLQCNMNTESSLQLGLDDLLADLRHARRGDDLGRLALLAYCEVRRWARKAGELELAEHSSLMFTGHPHATRGAFLVHIDDLIGELDRVRSKFLGGPVPVMNTRYADGPPGRGAVPSPVC